MARRVNPLISFAANLVLEGLGLSADTQAITDSDESNRREVEIGNTKSIISLRQKPGSVSLILGRREGGKTVLGDRLAELLGRPIYAVTPEQKPPKGVIEIGIEQVDELPPPYSTLLLDDAPVYMSSRDYHDHKVVNVEKLIPVVRHRRKLHLIFITQSSALSDRYILTSDIVLLKPPSILFMETERNQVVHLYQKVAPLFSSMSEAQKLRHVYLISEIESGMVRVGMPVFMK